MRAHSAHEILPESVAVLGELGACVGHDPDRDAFWELPYESGLVLCASGDGRQLFVLRPIADAGPVGRVSRQALHAANLHEKFMHRRADAWFNAQVPGFRKPVFRGELVIIRYRAAKDLDGDDSESWYEHYFAGPMEPAYPAIYSVGHGQLWIPPGPFIVAPQGIDFAPPPRARFASLAA